MTTPLRQERSTPPACSAEPAQHGDHRARLSSVRPPGGFRVRLHATPSRPAESSSGTQWQASAWVRAGLRGGCSSPSSARSDVLLQVVRFCRSAGDADIARRTEQQGRQPSHARSAADALVPKCVVRRGRALLCTACCGSCTLRAGQPLLTIAGVVRAAARSAHAHAADHARRR